MKILGVAPYQGEFKDRNTGESKQYQKVMLIVSERGQYPQLKAVDVDVWNAVGKAIQLGKTEVDILYRESYGKVKPAEIKVLG